MGLPAGYGKANNPTGKGLILGVNPGNSGKRIEAGLALTRMMSEILVEDSENGKKRVENMCRKIMQQAEQGDVQSASWYADRILGKPAVAVTVAGDPENPLNVAHSGEVTVSATDALIEAIIGFGEDVASSQSRSN